MSPSGTLDKSRDGSESDLGFHCGRYVNIVRADSCRPSNMLRHGPSDLKRDLSVKNNEDSNIMWWRFRDVLPKRHWSEHSTDVYKYRGGGQKGNTVAAGYRIIAAGKVRKGRNLSKTSIEDNENARILDDPTSVPYRSKI